MNKIRGLEDCLIPNVFETEKDAREVVYELARLGRRINGNNVINEIIYRKENKLKDEKNLPAYRNSEILKDNQKKKTLDLFVEQYGKKKRECFQDINRILIPWVFGDGFIKVFNYSQRKLNQTQKQRIGGEKFKDAYIFIHIIRTVGILQEFGATDYQKRSGFIHDDPEELRDKRIERIDNLVAGSEEETKLKKDIKNAPEYKEIYNLLVKRRRGNWKEIIDEKEAKLTIHHLRLLTRRVNESYKGYVRRMVNGCSSEYITKSIKQLTSNPEEQMNLYAAPLICKAADSIDNTRRVREGDISQKISRLSHNLILINGTDWFLNKYKLKPKILINLRKELIKRSQNEIISVYQQYKGDKDLAVKAKLTKFREMETEYNSLKKYLNVNK